LGKFHSQSETSDQKESFFLDLKILWVSSEKSSFLLGKKFLKFSSFEKKFFSVSAPSDFFKISPLKKCFFYFQFLLEKSQNLEIKNFLEKEMVHFNVNKS